MIDESVRLRVPVSVHLHTPNTTQFVVDNGASFIEHGSMIDEETMDLMAEKGVAYMPTVNRYIQAANANETWFNSLPSYAAEQYRELGPMMKITQEVLVDKINDNQSNLKVGYGSDFGYDQPLLNNWKEMEALVDLGLTPVQALKAATSVAADIIDRPDLGTLEVNKTADIVAWDEDVTQDWEAIKNNVFVMKEGKIYKTPE
jgi:imidazolonepropionase-like amidohydrolase